jgi:hypothetical protein
MRERARVMAYKYTLGDAGNMSNRQLLDALIAREIAPRTIVGTGYKNGRQVAIDYLREMIDRERGGASE